VADVLTLVAEVLGAAAAFLLPGWAWTVAIGPDRPWPVRLAVAAVVGVLVVPLASFAAAWVLETNVRPPLVVGVGLVLAASGFAVGRLARRS